MRKSIFDIASVSINISNELYQMMLLAFLLLDNVDRTENVKELKEKIIGG
jgi:hypothetical protein